MNRTQWTHTITAAAILLAIGTAAPALAGDRDRRNDSRHDRRHDNRQCNDRPRTSISIGIGTGFRSGYSSGWNSGWNSSSSNHWNSKWNSGWNSYGRDRCDTVIVRPRPVYYDPCPPVYVRPRPVVVNSCPPPVVVQPTPVYVSRPVYIDRPVVVERPVVYVETVKPRVVRNEELLSSSSRELGDNYLRLGDADNAERVYRNHLSQYPGDAQAMRQLALALLIDRRPDEAMNTILAAYQIDPGLVSRPLQLALISEAWQRQAADDAIRAADRANTAGGWLLAATMFQAQGKPEAARSAIERGRGVNLDREVLAAWDGALPK